MSLYNSYGLSILISDPLWGAVRSPQGLPIREQLQSWEHEINVDGGYKSAKAVLTGHDLNLTDFMETGLGRHVEFYDPSLSRRWEGFVDKVSINFAGLSVVRGPLTGVANRVLVAYTPYVDLTVDPPTTGAETITTFAEDTESQDKYAIHEEVVSGGTLMDDATVVSSGSPDNEAEALRDAYLAEMKYPETSQELSLGGGEPVPSITLDCLGYSAFFGRYLYDSTNNLTVTHTTKITNVLGGDPNSIFSTDHTYIEDNAMLTTDYEDQYRTAESILKELVVKGNASAERMILGVYNDRVVRYETIPSTVEYLHEIGRRGDQLFRTMDSRPIEPWAMLPGKWIFLSTILIGKSQIDTLREDPRNMFIESVRYRAPFDVELNGSKTGRIAQILAQKGLST